MTPTPPTSPLFPYTTLFRSLKSWANLRREIEMLFILRPPSGGDTAISGELRDRKLRLCRQPYRLPTRSEEHTSELQSRLHLVCRLLLEKKNDVNTLAHTRLR